MEPFSAAFFSALAGKLAGKASLQVPADRRSRKKRSRVSPGNAASTFYT